MTSEEFFNTVRDAINPDFHCQAHGGKLEHIEQHHDGSTSSFCLKPSGKMVAFSLDKKGKDPFPILAPGLNSRNDLTVVCLGSDGTALVFVIECKNSGNPGNAQHQIECGIAFCEYLFKVMLFTHGAKVAPRYFGVAAYRPATPLKGTTRPKFVDQGKHGVLRAEWPIAVALPLAELIRAAEACK